MIKQLSPEGRSSGSISRLRISPSPRHAGSRLADEASSSSGSAPWSLMYFAITSSFTFRCSPQSSPAHIADPERRPNLDGLQAMMQVLPLIACMTRSGQCGVTLSHR